MSSTTTKPISGSSENEIASIIAKAPNPHEPIQLCLFSLGTQLYALPVVSVLRIFPAVSITPLVQRFGPLSGIINIHGRIVPVCDLRNLFGGEPTTLDLNQVMILAIAGKEQVALLVDNVLDVITQEVISVSAAEAPSLSNKLKATLRRNPAYPVIVCGIARQNNELILYIDPAPLAPLVAHVLPEGGASAEES